jgi:predicted deacetylase
MIVVIRDDDTCGFTNPEEIRYCYGGIWNDIPVSLSVTPYRIPGNDKNLPSHLKGKMDIYPLHKNTELVDMLRAEINAGRIDISMHGYHHLCYNGLPEYVSGKDLKNKTKSGRSYLENVLGLVVSTFVPPNNGISHDGVAAVVAAGMNLVNVPSLWSIRHRPVSMYTLMHAPVYYWHRKVRGMLYPHILDMGDHLEVQYHTVGPRSQRKKLLQELEYCKSNNGVFVLSTHYHAFEKQTQDGQTVQKLVMDLIDNAGNCADVRFLGINSIW